MSRKSQLRLADRLLIYAWLPLSVGPMIWGGIATAGVQLHHIAVLLVYAYAFFLSFMRGTITKINIYFVMLLSYILLSGMALNGVSLDFWLKYLSYVGVVVVVNHVAKSMPFEVFCLYAASALKAVLLVCIIFAILMPSSAFQVVDGLNSLNGVYAQKNTLGRLLYFLIFFVSLRAVSNGRRLRKRDLVWIVVCAVCLYLSNSRTAQAMGLVLAIVPFAFRWRFARFSVVPVLVMSLIAVASGFVSGLVSFGGLGSNHDYLEVFGNEVSLSGRATIWEGALRGLNEEARWLFGFGLEGFYGSNFKSYVSNIGLGVFVPADSHNGYVDLLLNFGLVGVILFLVIGVRFYVNSWRFPNGGTKIAILAFIVLYIGSNFTESYFVKTSNITSFMFLLMFLYSYSWRGSSGDALRKSVVTQACTPAAERQPGDRIGVHT